MKFILLMNFSFIWKTFFLCTRRVIKYKSEFAKCVQGVEEAKWKIRQQIILYYELLSLLV